MEVVRNPPAPGWRMVGQIEQGHEGTVHYQGMLSTPQVRFSAVKKIYPRAHIEVAKNKKALEKYVQKEDTRVQSVQSDTIPSIFEYQTIIAKRWSETGYAAVVAAFPRKDRDELAMLYLDSLVAQDIATGRRGAEWIATNPMWRNAWKKFWRVIIQRENASVERVGNEVEGSSPAVSPQEERSGDCKEDRSGSGGKEDAGL